MGIRLALQPLWVRFLVWSVFMAVLWFCVSWLGPPSQDDTLGNTVVTSLVMGVVFAATFTYMSRTAHRATVAAVAGLDQAQRAQAIAAVTRGVLPGDPAVRSAAMRLGVVVLRGKSAAQRSGKSVAQRKRQKLLGWIALLILVALCIWGAVSWSDVRFLVLALFVVVAVPLGMLRTRRIQRNVALLSESLPAPAIGRRCPRCDSPMPDHPTATSRATPDGSIRICDLCGGDEAIEQDLRGRVTPVAEWPVSIDTINSRRAG